MIYTLKKILVFIIKIFIPFEKSIDRSNIKTILIMDFGHVGDLVLSMPAIVQVSKMFPEAKIDLCCGEWGKNLFEYDKSISNIIVFDHFLYNRQKDNLFSKFLKSIISLITLRKKKHDLSIDLRGNWNSGIINLFVNSRWKIGLNMRNYDFPYNYSSPDIADYEVNNKLNLLKFFDNKITFEGYNFLIPEQKIEKVEKILANNSISSKKYVIVHTLTPWKPRNWDFDRYKQLIEKLLLKYDINIILIGTEKEFHKNQEMLKIYNTRVLNFCGKLDILETAYLIKNAILYIGCDSGPMHVAAAVETDIIALMGPGEYPRFAPFNPKIKTYIIRHAVCVFQNNNNCEQNLKSEQCGMNNNICMQAISVDEVFLCAKSFLDHFELS